MRVTGTALLKEASHQNAVIALWQVIDMFDVPVAIRSGNGLCFVGRGNCKKKTGTWTPTLFEKTYHQHSIVESVFSSFKCRFTTSCSRKEDGNAKKMATQRLHLLLRCVCYNLLS